MRQTLNTLGFVLTDQDQASTQYSKGLIDVFIQSNGKTVLVYNSIEIIDIKDDPHLRILVEAIEYK